MAEVLDFKCPNCGASLQFDSTLQEMKCEYCGSELNVESVKSYNEILNGESEDKTEWKTEPQAKFDESDGDFGVFICNSCGGEIVADATASALQCPFCNSAVVLTERVSGYLKPDCIIPFKLDKKAAKTAFFEHLKGKRLLPKVFKTESKIDEIKGIYVPFWLYDTGVDADIRYRGTRINRWSDSRYNYTETQHYSIIRAGNIAFANVPVDGSSKMPNDLMESLEPYDISEAVDFNTAYLAGYLADKYDVDSSQNESRANQRIKHSTEDAFRSTVHGFVTVTPEHSSLRYYDGVVRYALYPVWLMNATYKGEKFTFAMNGQTGKFVGNLPMSKAAFWKWFSIIGGAVAAGLFGILVAFGKMGGWL